VGGRRGEERRGDERRGEERRGEVRGEFKENKAVGCDAPVRRPAPWGCF
jgi:hypothetical protein